MFFNQYKLRVHSLITIIEYIAMKKIAFNTKSKMRMKKKKQQHGKQKMSIEFGLANAKKWI